MRAVAWTTFVVAVLAGLPRAAGDEGNGPQARVARLVRLLGSRSYRERTLATEELERLGTAARASLEREADSSNPEIRNRARALLAKLNIAQLWEPSRVTVQCQEESARKLIDELAKQSGNHVAPGDHYASCNDGPVTLSAIDQPFWAVLDEICRQSGNRVRPHYDHRKQGFVVVSGSAGEFPLAYAGPVRGKITAARRSFSQALNHRTGESEIAHSFQLDVQLTWEDRFRLVAFRSQAELVDAITDTNVKVAATGCDCGEWTAATGSTRQVSMTLALQPPPTTAKQLDVLRLKWQLIAVGDMAEMELSDLQSRQQHQQDDVRLAIRSWEQPSESRYKMTLLVNRDLVIPEPSSVAFHENEIDLLDTQGQPLRKTVGGWRMAEEGLQVRLSFTRDAGDTAPQRLRFRYPRIRSQRNLEIVFRNVPLPHERPE